MSILNQSEESEHPVTKMQQCIAAPLRFYFIFSLTQPTVDDCFGNPKEELESEIQPFVNLGLILNCSINLIIYVLTSPNFRKVGLYNHLPSLGSLVSCKPGQVTQACH